MDSDRTRAARRRGEHRALNERSFAASVGLTVVGAIVPGSGFWFAGRRRLGAAIIAVALAGLATALLFGLLNPRFYLHSVLQPSRLAALVVALVVIAVAWVVVIVLSHLALRPSQATGLQRVIGGCVAMIMCAVVATPFAVGASYAYTTWDFINQVFPNDTLSKTTPKNASADNPWAGEPRVNILLLGGDGSVNRQGVRTDSMIVASIDTATGDTVLFSLPRNLEDAPFPPDTPLAKVYPNGFQGPGDEGNWMLNAIYRMVPEEHPGLLGATDNEGADALKMAISQILGLNVNYYVLINLQGFVQLVNALGGITVNIDQVVPIGGKHDQNIPPTGYIQPGPNRHLDGHDALWFARGRWTTDDYDRMERQRCVIDAVIKQANPENLLLRYNQIAAAGKKITRTDIPQRLLPALVDLGLKVKDAKVRSVVFQPNDQFNPASPDFAYIHSIVSKALHPVTPGVHKPKIIQPSESACAYNPAG
jgi:polyisoprenyl-teichoic acid--peptidoglycan teichoic acid transferase